ncbi:MAG: pyruvate kinase [Anaerolineaceae bacterium]|jgi:pyruvate kinase
MKRRAKIVATLGPASNDEATIEKLFEAGMDVARLNFSHGVHEEHAARIELIRKISDKLKKPVTILQDLQGPKMRVGVLPTNGIQLTPGQSVTLAEVAEKAEETPSTTVIPFNVPNFNNALSRNSRILLDDGRLELQVISVTKDSVEAKVIQGGILTSHKGVNLPGAALNIASFTEKDRSDLEFGLKNGVDMIAASFVCTAADIITLRDAVCQLDSEKQDIPIVAKLERPEALENLDGILNVTDGVMVARGDLAVETSTAAVPIMQKKIIQEASRRSRFVITATQMLESMMQNPRPTRAEASDVANAIFDGTDAVMLSGESASGNFPVESVQTMASIVCESEKNYAEWGHFRPITNEMISDDAIAITRAAHELSHDRQVAGIAVFTLSGHTALLMSKTRPDVPIMAFTPNKNTYQRLGMYWGVDPFLISLANSVEEMLSMVEKEILSSTSIRAGQQIVLISGLPIQEMKKPNFALLHTIGGTI